MASSIVDVAIVGAGPSALTAAMYLARDGLKVLVLEKDAVGGQVAITDKVENYPGFPDGVSGLELAKMFRVQAEKFCAVIRLAEVNGLSTHGDISILSTESGEIKARAVLIATGSSPKLLNIPGESKFLGRGVSICATCDGAFYKDQQVAVVGGANAAIQETLYLSSIVKHIALIVRSELKASQVLINQLNNLVRDGRVTLYQGYKPIKIIGESAVTRLEIKPINGEGSKILEASSIFVFIGRQPSTDFVDNLKTDKMGFIVTDTGLMTSQHGVFASGDVRAGSTKQVASAVGEGAEVAISIRHFLSRD